MDQQTLLSANPEAIDIKKMRGFIQTIWIFFGNRTYKRNVRDRLWPLFTIGLYLVAIFSIVFFEFLPLKYFMFIFMFSMNILALTYPIGRANKYPQAGWCNLIVGIIGLFFHIHFGLTIFNYHLEAFLFGLYAIAGFLAVARRVWNAIIWHLLDKIILNYYKKEGLSMPSSEVL